MSGIQQLLLGGSPAGYQIERSLRFNSADSAYLSRTPSSAGNRTTWTMSMWVKRGALGTMGLFSTINSGTVNTTVGFNNDTIDFLEYQSATVARLVTTQVFRDPSAWYHIVAVWNSTSATSSDRVQLYVNGSRITALSTATYPTQNLTSTWNNNVNSSIGTYNNGSPPQFYLNGYLTEVNFIDGQALTPSSFGQSDPNTGVWSPIKYTGTYGTNGFYLNFSDNSNTTAATLGKDYSGNGNNWTPNNFSVTAGAGNDSLVDTPTSYGSDTGVGGEVRGNYATWNPLAKSLLTGTFTFSNGNLDVSDAASSYGAVLATLGASSGKWYWEVTCVSSGGSSGYIGIVPSSATDPTVFGYPGAGGSYSYSTNGQKFTSNSGTTYGATYTTGDIIGVALDLDAGTLVFYKNGSSQGTAFSSLSGSFVPSVGDGAGATQYSWTANFGQRPFAYTAPSGFKALCTQNLPTPTIGATSTTQANDYFDINLYTGNGSTQSITNSGGFQPDFIWIKRRNTAAEHQLYDALRGVQKALYTSLTNAETTQTGGVTAFNSNGFTVGSDGGVNANGDSQIAWQWNAGGSNATNTSGTITSTVRANTTAGFSIVTYTGTGANATVGHGLGVAPRMFITKNRDSGTPGWAVYHASVGNTGALALNATTAVDTNSVYFNNTTPTSTVFSVGTGTAVNTNTQKYVAYCFAEVAGYSAFGSYTGNGSTDGPFVYTGFRPKWVMLKSATQAYRWYMLDAARNTYNIMNARLFANDSAAEATNSDILDFTSNGFKIRNSDAEVNGSGQTIIFAAFAEVPMKFSLAR